MEDDIRKALLGHVLCSLPRPETDDQVAGSDQRECFLLGYGPMSNRSGNLGIEPREAG